MSSELYGGQDPITVTETVVLHPDDVTVVTDDQGRTVGYVVAKHLVCHAATRPSGAKD